MGRTTTYDYDTNSRLTSRTYPDPAENVSFTYTATGRRLTATDARGTTEYGYDLRDRLTSLTQPSVGALGYAYDNNGNRTGLTATIGTQVLTTTFTYDDANRLDIVTDPAARTYDHGYDANGNRGSLAHPNGTQTAYAYDTLNRLRDLTTTHPASGVTIQGYAFTLGPAGNRTRIVEHDATVRDFGYDDLCRLTSEAVTISGLTQYGKTFLYDNVGNRQTQTTTGAGSPGTPTAPGTVGYAYDTRDRITTEGSQVYGWDQNGNLTSKDAEATYVWDFENRLTRVTKLDGTVVEHVYDVDGNRVQTKTTPPGEPTSTTNFLVDTSGGLSHVVAETDEAGAIKAYYVRGDDLLAVMRPLVPTPTTPAEWQTRFVHADGLGSIRRLTAENGLITDGYSYTAFGELLAHTGTDPQPYAFAGEPYDPNVGFQYHRARWMDPSVGRSVGMDSFVGQVREPNTLHRYLYVSGDPVNRVDPTGLFEGLAVSFAAIGISFTIAGISQLVPHRTAPERVSLSYRNHFSMELDDRSLQPLTPSEVDLLKAWVRFVFYQAYSGLAIELVEGSGSTHPVNVLDDCCGGDAGETGLSGSDVNYGDAATWARSHGQGKSRDAIVKGMGHALGAIIAHEAAHQFVSYTHDPDDGAAYDYRYTFRSADWFYGQLHWTAPTRELLRRKLAYWP